MMTHLINSNAFINEYINHIDYLLVADAVIIN